MLLSVVSASAALDKLFKDRMAGWFGRGSRLVLKSTAATCGVTLVLVAGGCSDHFAFSSVFVVFPAVQAS